MLKGLEPSEFCVGDGPPALCRVAGSVYWLEIAQVIGSTVAERNDVVD